MSEGDCPLLPAPTLCRRLFAIVNATAHLMNFA
jgi:hypothetical protein